MPSGSVQRSCLSLPKDSSVSYTDWDHSLCRYIIHAQGVHLNIKGAGSCATLPATRTSAPIPRNTRHTTHVQQLPPSVRIIREKHALEGRILGVLGHMRRRSGLQLILALPEGGTASVPASWTDLESPAAAGVNQNHRGRTLGSAADLLHTRSVVDALLRPLDSEHSCPAAEEGSNATGASAVARETAGLGASECRASSDADQGTCAPHEKSCPCGAEEGHQ